MKKLFPLLVLALLLMGCGAQEVSPAPTAAPTVAPSTEPTGYYDPDSALEAASGGAIRVYPLDRTGSSGIFSMGQDILLFSGTSATTLTRLTGSQLFVAEVANLNRYVDPEDPAVQISEKGVTYYDSLRRELVFLDGSLKEAKRVSLPAQICGSPALTQDRKTLYYCTADALRAIDLETGLDKLLKEMSYPDQALTGLHCGDSILECTVPGSQLYISAYTGETLSQASSGSQLYTQGDQYFICHYDSAYLEYLTGSADQGPTLLNADSYTTTAIPVLEIHSVLLLHPEGDDLSLELYDLYTGQQTAARTLPGTELPKCAIAQADQNCLWLLRCDDPLGCDVLYRWDLSRSESQQESIFLPRWTGENPDLEGLAQCQILADAISQEHGVQVLLWQDAVAAQSWEYTLEPEYQVPLIRNQLTLLQEALSCYPQGFLAQAASRTDNGVLSICLVRSIQGHPDAAVPSSVNGLQFWDTAGSSYVCITAGEDLSSSVHHELFHLIESYVLVRCTTYDDWDKLNPEDFSYDNNYLTNQNRTGEEFLEGESRAFIDHYSMSFPREDRARIFEYAMTPGNGDVFDCPILQEKLQVLCSGIRRAFKIEDPSPLPWEQYLMDKTSG